MAQIARDKGEREIELTYTWLESQGAAQYRYDHRCAGSRECVRSGCEGSTSSGPSLPGSPTLRLSNLCLNKLVQLTAQKLAKEELFIHSSSCSVIIKNHFCININVYKKNNFP